MDSNEDRSLILRPPLDVGTRQLARNRIVDRIVERLLVLAKEIAAANIDLDTLVREGKRIRRREGMSPEDVMAFRMFYRAATAGHSEAQFLVCECYDYGCGIKRDRVQSLKWLRESADSGFAIAQNRLGFEIGEQDRAEAFKWFQMAAEQNHTKAQLNLGNCYRYGKGVARDPVEAAKWYRKAAHLHNARAQTLLGNCYRDGSGVRRNHREAIAWWEKAAEQGEARAQYNLGACYAKGRCIMRDEGQAAKWWQKAAEQGHSQAQYDLGERYAEGRGVSRNLIQAYKWLHLAASRRIGKTAKKEAEAKVGTLEVQMTTSEIETALALCREFEDKELSNYPRWLRELFAASSE